MTMQPQLYFTASEQQMFDRLPEQVKEGWSVQKETQTYADTDEKRQMRCEIVRLNDPKLRDFRNKALKAKSVDELHGLMDTIDFTHVHDDDVVSLFFALGPTMLTDFIGTMFSETPADDLLERIAALTMIRHSLFKHLIAHE